ncbi:E3 ubiquitin/ISG15 ligase TRIM25-like [Pseudophryne corroboree]|uniref:E3 ubiquitin/ISG15 ligase TRIM25-like n=1 Tax=Pseudophryne corroboree TaxID=495146 RepID=UPI00308182F2
MASDLRQELDCSICLSMYTDPVTLRCGHNFCRVCIDRVLDTQEEAGVYICPDCRAECQERPVLQRNITLCNIVGSFLSTRPDQRDTGIFCTYCIHSIVPAAKSCQHCEASLCDNHLRVHSKSAEHVLCDLTTALGNRKCSVHKKVLEYYCTEDAACICVSCCLIGKHRGHQMESLGEASEKKKEKLRQVLQKLALKRTENEKRVQSLHERRREDRGKAAGVTALFRDLRKQLEDLEKRVLSEISRQEQRVSLSFSDTIQQLEKRKDELSRKMRHIEELCNMSDPVTVLQEPDTGDLCDTDETERYNNQVRGAEDLDVGLISRTLQTLSDVIKGINTRIYVQEATDILLDVAIAGDIDSKLYGINTGVYVQEPTDMLLVEATASDTNSKLYGINTGVYVQEATDKLLDVDIAGDIKSYMSGINTGVYVQEATDLLLDVATAGNNIQISGDRKTAFRSPNYRPPVTPDRFRCRQVISTRGFSSGRHYWEMDVSKSMIWRVGMGYPSIDRRGRWSPIGCNYKSWALCRRGYTQLSVRHGSIEIPISDNIPCDRLRIYLDYEAGQLSFYSLRDRLRHLYTYTATFTEPIHAILWVGDNCITISGVHSWEKLP